MADEEGNPATVGDASWEPLLATPPYPDYVRGLCAVIGAATHAPTRVLGTSRIDLRISSPATDTTRHYDFAADLCADAINARVWSGIHFRSADVVTNEMGTQVAGWALDHYFQPGKSAGEPASAETEPEELDAE